MKKGQSVVKLLSVNGIETATVEKVASVSRGSVWLDGYEHQMWDSKTGKEIDPMYGSSRLIEMGGY